MTQIQGVSASDIKWCENYRCKRHKVPIAFPGKRCHTCNAKMRPLTTDELKNFVGELVIDDSPRANDEINPTLPLLPAPETMANDRRSSDYVTTGSSVIRKPDHTPGYSTTPNTSKKGNDTWGCADAEVKGECPIYKATPPQVYLPNHFFMNWVWLAKRISTEWMAYMIGKEEKQGDQIIWTVSDFYFPKQVVTPTHVEAEDNQVRDGVIGSVHSHVQMQAFFSGEDEKHMNHPCELVLNARGDIKASIRVQLECGRFNRVEGKVMLTAAQEVQDLHAALEKLMTERKYTSSSYSRGGHSPNSYTPSDHSDRGYTSYGLNPMPNSTDTWKA